MRGSPLFRALIAFVALALVGWPLWRLTRAGESVVPSVVAADVPVAKAHVSIALTAPARSVRVLHLNKEVWSSADAAGEIEGEFAILWPKEGVDLRFQIQWPDDAPLAGARVRLSHPDNGDYERSIFSKGPADEVLTFK